LGSVDKLGRQVDAVEISVSGCPSGLLDGIIDSSGSGHMKKAVNFDRPCDMDDDLAAGRKGAHLFLALF
jgi:hypothetical protein